MSRLAGAMGVLMVLALSMGFAALNGAQRVTLRLGFITFYGVPLTVVAFGGLVAGMVIMLGAGIHSDLKVRRILRARLMEEDLEEKARFVDGSQQDLFEGEGQPGAELHKPGAEQVPPDVRSAGEGEIEPTTRSDEQSEVEEQSD